MPKRADGSVCYADTHYRDTWVAMETLVDKGLVKAIGLSNFNARQTDDVLSIAKHKPVVNQVRERENVCVCEKKREGEKLGFERIQIKWCNSVLVAGGVSPISVPGRAALSLPLGGCVCDGLQPPGQRGPALGLA